MYKVLSQGYPIYNLEGHVSCSLNVFSVPFFNQFKVSIFSTIDIVIRQNLKGREAALEIKKKN